MHAPGGNHAQEADTGIRVNPACTGGISGLPVPEIIHQLISIMDSLGDLQRQAARSVRAKIYQADVVKAAAAQGRNILTGAIGQRQLSRDLSVRSQCCCKYLTIRSNLKKRLVCDRFLCVDRRYAVVAKIIFPIDSYRDRHAWNPILLHQGEYYAVNCGGYLVLSLFI